MTPAVSIILPLRNRPLAMLDRTLASIRWQSKTHSAEVVVVNNGSTAALSAQLRPFCAANDVKLVEFDSGVWNKPRTSNVGLQAATPSSPYLMTMDIDILLAPNFFDALFTTPDLGKKFILCQVGELPDGVQYPDPLTPLGYTILKTRAEWPAPTHGIGGIQFAPRRFWFDIRGYDEDMLYWGSMDSDMADRSGRYGLARTWLNKSTTMLHQPHTKKGRILPTQALKDEAMRYHAQNRKLRHSRVNILERNPNGWGEQ